MNTQSDETRSPFLVAWATLFGLYSAGRAIYECQQDGDGAWALSAGCAFAALTYAVLRLHWIRRRRQTLRGLLIVIVTGGLAVASLIGASDARFAVRLLIGLAGVGLAVHLVDRVDQSEAVRERRLATAEAAKRHGELLEALEELRREVARDLNPGRRTPGSRRSRASWLPGFLRRE